MDVEERKRSMTSRVKDDPSLKRHAESRAIVDPVIIVQAEGSRVTLIPQALREMNHPKAFGIILSDLVDHIGKYYSDTTGRDERDVRATVMKALHDENRFKEKDPDRAGLTRAIGGTGVAEFRKAATANEEEAEMPDEDDESFTEKEYEEMQRFWKQADKETAAAKEDVFNAELKFAKRMLELAEGSGIPTVVTKAAEMRAMFLTRHPFPPAEVLCDFFNRINLLSAGHLPKDIEERAKAIGETFVTRAAVEWMAQFGEPPVQ
jgi:hypothetical protein